jgi:hypothetical protein
LRDIGVQIRSVSLTAKAKKLSLAKNDAPASIGQRHG